jgi:hypothetical protein
MVTFHEVESLWNLVVYLLHSVFTTGKNFAHLIGLTGLDYYDLWALGLIVLCLSAILACVFWYCLFAMLYLLHGMLEHMRRRLMGRMPVGIRLDRPSWQHDLAYHWIPCMAICALLFGLPVHVGRIGCHVVPAPICVSLFMSGYIWMGAAALIVCVTILSAALIMCISDGLGDRIARWV